MDNTINLDKLRIEDPSGCLSREKYVSKNFPNEYRFIMDECSLNGLDLPFKEKVYCVLNNISNIQICKNSLCNNKVKYRNKVTGYNTYCCNKCQSTCSDIIEKKKQTNIEKFGHEHAIFNDEINDKFKQNIQKTKVEQDIVNKKRVDTVKKRYGVNSVANIEDIQKKRVASFKENVEQYKESYKKTSLERYNVEHPWMDNEIHDKTVLSNLENHDNTLRNTFKDLEIKSISRDTDENNFLCKCDLGKKHDFNIHYSLLNGRYRRKSIICTECNPIDDKVSSFHLEVLEYIKSIYNGSIIVNDREVIKPLEIDIYLPEKGIGIECNGLYWHSEKYKNKKYHQNKYLKSKEANTKLIQIYDDDWNLKKDIIKSRISNQLHLTNNRIYSRKCVVKVVDSNIECRNFLTENHLQGFVGSTIKLGLYYNDELVSLMTFGKTRKALNSISTNENDYELLRFCNLKNTNVIGSASKLFKHFITNYEHHNITSYAMLEWGEGEFYSKLGFVNNGMTMVGYYYIINGVKKHRFQFQKQKLIKEGFDSNKTEYEIMLERGYDRIWTVGNMKWLYTKKAL
jgi:hypothetical protein